MKNNRLRDAIRAGGRTLGTRMSTTWPFFIELVGNSGNFDYVEYVAEYSPFSQYDLENMARAAELSNMGTMIKVDFQNSAYIAQKAAASGFQAILFTDVHNADEVRAAVKTMKADSTVSGGRFGYPNRRFIGYQPFLKQMEHAERVNDIVLAFMIEKSEAMDNIEEICSVKGVDMVQFGPSDFSMSNGHNAADFKEECKKAERKMIETALKHGVRPRCEIYGKIEDVQYYLDLGVKDICFGDQIKVYDTFINQQGAAMKEFLSNK